MILMAILSSACVVLATIALALMDTLQFRYKDFVFAGKVSRQWWNPRHSWRNKYKGGDPEQGEKFWLSSSILVFTTDAWHFFKFVMLNCYLIAIILPFTQVFDLNFLLWVAIFFKGKAVFGYIFHLFFHNVFTKAKN